MKIKPEHFNHIKQEIDNTLSLHGRDNLIKEYETGLFPRSDKTKDLQQRFCFDLMYAAGLSQYVCNTLYSYLNDDHIYTALKSICPTVTRQY